MMRLQATGLLLAAVMLMGSELDTPRAAIAAQMTYTTKFSITYDTLVKVDPSYRPDLGISRATITGENAKAPFGLTNVISNTYSKFDPTTNTATFDANPAVFGLEAPVLSDRYFGGPNELFGTASDKAVFNFEEMTVAGGGTITITGGTGVFEGATGKIVFTQNDKLTSTDLTQPFRGKANLDFSIQTPKPVPEPTTHATAMLAFAGMIGAGSLWRRRGAAKRPVEAIPNHKVEATDA